MKTLISTKNSTLETNNILLVLPLEDGVASNTNRNPDQEVQSIPQSKEIVYNIVFETREKNCDYQAVKTEDDCMTNEHVGNESQVSVSESFVTQPDLIKEEIVVLVENEQCNSTATKTRGQYAHLKVGTGENVVFKCDQCEKQLKAASSFAKHYRKHLDLIKVKRHVCDQCDKAFSTREILTVHYRKHTGETPFVCDLCGKTFVSRANLTCHLRVHSGERPYSCKQCSKTFTTHSNLAHHSEVHTAKKRFHCQVCGKTFGYNSALKVHLRRHFGDRPFKCDECSKSFVDSGQLVIHKRKHSGERPYVCEFCGKGFIDGTHKTIHTRIHTGDKPFKCKICPDKGFVQKMQLQLHMRTYHGIK